MRGRVQLYAVNLLLVERFLRRENRRVVWTRIARNGYGQLFKPKQPYVQIALFGYSVVALILGFFLVSGTCQIIHGIAGQCPGSKSQQAQHRVLLRRPKRREQTRHRKKHLIRRTRQAQGLVFSPRRTARARLSRAKKKTNLVSSFTLHPI